MMEKWTFCFTLWFVGQMPSWSGLRWSEVLAAFQYQKHLNIQTLHYDKYDFMDKIIPAPITIYLFHPFLSLFHTF